MCHDDKLTLPAKLCNVFRKALHICLIQRSLNLIKNTKRHRSCLQNREQDTDGDQTFFSTAEQTDILYGFSRRLHIDINTGIQHILRIHHEQACLTASKQRTEDIVELCVDLIKHLLKLLDHDIIHFINGLQNLILGSHQVIPLSA